MAGRRFCTHCGASCRGADRFCGACGEALRAPAVHWGEVKPATILFADIVDSTQRIAALTPEQAMQQLQPAIERMVALVEQHGGTVLRTLGDGIMALFGVPRALEQHAEQACLAAMRMQRLVATASAGPSLALRIGVHTGKVASDPTEAGDRRGGGAHGVAIHLASRVAAQAEPGEVLLTEDTRHLLRPGLLTARPVGSWHLKGIVQPVALYALRLDAGGGVMPDGALRAGRFVGRDDEMAQLLHALGRTRAGQGQVICVGGEAGRGKTRLCLEFARHCQHQGMPVVWVQAHPLSHALPLRPARELLAALCLRLAPTPTPTDARRCIQAALARAGHTSAVDLALVCELMDVTDEVAVHTERQLSGRDSRQLRLLTLVADLVRVDADSLRLVVVEDLHWLDLASWPILNAVVEALSTTHTLLLANHRPELPAPWQRLSHVAALPLGALSPRAVRAIVAEHLGQSAAARGGESALWIDRVTERSQGNPFFAKELVRHLRRTSADAARIDALSEIDKRVLQTCAVIGKQVDLAVLARVLRLPPGQLAASLRRLQAADLLAGAGGGPDAMTLAFVHPLIQEAAYGAQLQAQRAGVHARVAEVIARRCARGARAGELAALMAHHHEQAGQSLPAARCMVRAAQWLRTGDAAVAIAAWRRVLLLLEGEQTSEEARALSALAAGRILFLGWRVGITAQEITQLIERALGHAGGADPRLPQLLRFAHARMLQASGGSADDYLRAVQDVLAMPDPPGDPGRRATLHVVLCQAYSWAGLLRQALAASDVALEHIAQVSGFDRDFIGFSVEQWAVGLRVRVLSRMGRLTEARACCERLVVLAREEPDVVMRGIEQSVVLELDCLQGRSQRVWAMVRQLDRKARQQNDYLRITDAYFFSMLEIASHHYAVACSQIQDGLSYLRERRVAVDFEAELLALRAEALAARASWSAAAQAAQEAVVLARQRGNRVAECRAALVLARAQRRGKAGRSELQGDWLAVAGELLDITGAELWRPMWRALQAYDRASAPP